MYLANANPLLPYRLQAGYEGYCGGSEVTTDAQGNRVVTPNYSSIAHVPGGQPERTILILGDSGVFGFGLPDRDTIASQLQSVCAQRNLRYEIHNIGVPGYTSWNEYAAYVDYLKNHEITDLVLLYMPNDLTFDNDYFGIGRGNQASYSRNEDRVRRFLRGLYTRVYLASLLSDGLKGGVAVLRNKERPEQQFDAARVQPQLDYSIEALRKIEEMCDQKQIRFSVAIYRDVSFYYDAENWLLYEHAITSSLDQVGIRSFLAKSHIDRLSATEARVRVNDPHPSRKAVALIVEDILNELNRKQFVGPPDAHLPVIRLGC